MKRTPEEIEQERQQLLGRLWREGETVSKPVQSVTVNIPMEVHDEEKLMKWVEQLLDDDEAFLEFKSKPSREVLKAAVLLAVTTAFTHFVESEEPDWGIA